jgi:anti-sigma28 factor (negative regulator of flagellin synthesis)
MKIDQQNIAGVSSTQATTLNPASGQRNPAASGSSGDQAELSGLSKAIQSFQSDRTARVDKLTALVRSGKYDVNPSLVSGAIVREALSAGSQAPGAAAR